MLRQTTFIMAALALLVGCQSDISPIVACTPAEGMTPICGFQNPEDLAEIPDSKWLIVSQFGSMDGTRAGNLALFDRIEEQLQPAFTGGEGAVQSTWGDDDCPGAPGNSFSPHGVDLMQLASGRWRLLVVNHGSRESVEFFEVVNEEPLPRISWRGCVVGPEDAYFNDVVNLAGGGFLVTQMMPKSSESMGTLKGLLGMDTGYVLHWSGTDGFRQVAGTEAPFPNGIEVSANEAIVFVNVYMGDEVRKIRRVDGELLAKADVIRPDNITWGADGRLLVASHVDGLSELIACQGLTEGACGFEFEIVALDPVTMERTTLLNHRGPPMGAATVALQIGTRLYLGSFAGDRIAHVELAP